MALVKPKLDEEGELFKSNYYESDYAGWELKVVELSPNFFVVEGIADDGRTVSKQGFDKDTLIELVEEMIGELAREDKSE
jgi:hypothetical protein